MVAYFDDFFRHFTREVIVLNLNLYGFTHPSLLFLNYSLCK